MPKLVARFLGRVRPREGWLLLLLTLLALLCVPAAMVSDADEIAAAWLFALTALAGIAGLRLARSELSPRLVTVLGLLSGLALSITVAGRLTPPPGLLLRELGYTFQWLGQRLDGEIAWPLPFASIAGHIWQQTNALLLRLWWWGRAAVGGGTAQDSIALELLGAFVIWVSGLFAMWQIYRRREPLVALMPGGVVVAVLAFFRGGISVFYLLTYLGCTLGLLAICHLWALMDHWEATGTDHPGEMGLELALGLGPWLVILMLLASFFPVLHPRQIRDAFWDLMGGPWAVVQETSARLFGPIDGLGSGSGGGGSLPRLHLLGSGPELAETIVFYITTNDPAPPLHDSQEEPGAISPGRPQRYWRAITHDTYAGQGWTNSPLEPRTTPAGMPLATDLAGPGKRPAGGDASPEYSPAHDFELNQQFELATAGDGLLYAANVPLMVDQPVQTWWRTAGDLALTSSEASRYTVLSRPPQPTVDDLRGTPAILPPELAERYLALPDTVPQRVLRLAQEVTAEANTAYDQAHALEAFLRTYTYTLELPPPPAEIDLVDYFLFDLQKGYCDYYASAMVVMARAVGLPARLAAGYAQGTYDHEERHWIVAEKDGHSWVEIYFDGIGWVEFEPTAGLPALTRAGSQAAMPPIPPLPARQVAPVRIPWALVALTGALLLLGVSILCVWWPQRLEAGSAGDLVRDRYRRLLRWGAHFGRPLRDGQTPNEYGVALSNALRARAQGSRWPQVRQAGADLPPAVERLTDTLSRAQYSPEPITQRESWQIQNLWTRLRRHLWWLLLSR